MWLAWGGQWGAKSTLFYPDLLTLSIKKSIMLVGGWTETAWNLSVMHSLSSTSTHGRESLSPADLLSSHLAQHPLSSSFHFPIQLSLFRNSLTESFQNLLKLCPTHFGLKNILNFILVQYQDITEPVLSQSRTDLGLAVLYIIPKHKKCPLRVLPCPSFPVQKMFYH